MAPRVATWGAAADTEGLEDARAHTSGGSGRVVALAIELDPTSTQHYASAELIRPRGIGLALFPCGLLIAPN